MTPAIFIAAASMAWRRSRLLPPARPWVRLGSNPDVAEWLRDSGERVRRVFRRSILMAEQFEAQRQAE